MKKRLFILFLLPFAVQAQYKDLSMNVGVGLNGFERSDNRALAGYRFDLKLVRQTKHALQYGADVSLIQIVGEAYYNLHYNLYYYQSYYYLTYFTRYTYAAPALGIHLYGGFAFGTEKNKLSAGIKSGALVALSESGTQRDNGSKGKGFEAGAYFDYEHFFTKRLGAGLSIYPSYILYESPNNPERFSQQFLMLNASLSMHIKLY